MNGYKNAWDCTVLKILPSPLYNEKKNIALTTCNSSTLPIKGQWSTPYVMQQCRKRFWLFQLLSFSIKVP